MKYIDILKEAGFKEVYETCINVHTRNFDFNLAFISFETKEELGLFVTDDSGREKLKIINKDYIEYVEIVYQDDILTDTDEEQSDRMFH